MIGPAPEDIALSQAAAASKNPSLLCERRLELRRLAELGLDFEQAVVLGDALAAAGGAGLDLPAAHGDGEIGEERVFRLARAVRHDSVPAGLAAERDRLDRLGDGADLVQFDQDRVRRLFLDAASDEFGVGDENVVADDLDALTLHRGLVSKSLPVVFIEPVLDRDDGNVSIHFP